MNDSSTLRQAVREVIFYETSNVYHSHVPHSFIEFSYLVNIARIFNVFQGDFTQASH